MITSHVHRCCWRRWVQTLLAAAMLRAGKKRVWTCRQRSSSHAAEHHMFSFHPLSFRTPLHAAAFAGHVDCVQLLLSHDAPVDVAEQSGRTALMMAAQRGRVGALGTGLFYMSLCSENEQ